MNEKKQEAVSPDAAKAKKIPRIMFDYEAFLSTFPIPGGAGAHAGLYRLGILGYRAGIKEERVIADVTAKLDEYYAAKKARRIVSPEEIAQGIHAGLVRAVEERNGLVPPVERRTAPKLNRDAFNKIVMAGRGITVDDIMAKSPVPLNFPDWEAGWRTLEALYDPTDNLYIGESDGYAAPGRNIFPAGEWIETLKKDKPAYPFIIPNPLSGQEAPTKDGMGVTFRGDRNVVKFRHAVAEMDGESVEDQLAFWSFAALPVRALILSGGKSVHAWVDVDCKDVLEWELEVEGDLFPNYLVPLGCDPACRNESRISRLPGHFRADKGAVQKLIWLSPEGKAVCE